VADAYIRKLDEDYDKDAIGNSKKQQATSYQVPGQAEVVESPSLEIGFSRRKLVGQSSVGWLRS
jgi:hypothetical protein